jgi:hypothetical protein
VISVALGVVAVIAWVFGWGWLAIFAGVMAILVAALGFYMGALQGCMTTLIGWAVAVVGGAALLGPRFDNSAIAGALAGVAVVDMLWAVLGVAMAGLVNLRRK